MVHLLNIWPLVSERLKRAGRVLLLFDYDGTLTPIAARPEYALLPDDARRLLKALVAHPRYIAGIVSGRSIEDLSSLAGIPGLVLAGNHGMEIQGAETRFIHPDAAAAGCTLNRMRGMLNDALAHIPGVIVEHKILTLTVHYRAAPERLAEEIDALVTRVSAPCLDSGEIRLTRGKMVVEVRPAIAWDKGKAIEKIREECGDRPFPVYFGDDCTDEDGFRIVQEMGGLAVFVGKRRQGTAALHQLDSPLEVAETMRLLLEES